MKKKIRHNLTPQLKAVLKAVKGSYLDADSEGPHQVPFVTIDGKRQVVYMPGCTGFDLWVPRRNPRPYDDVTCSLFNKSFEQAVAFLCGATHAELDEMDINISPNDPDQKIWKTLNKCITTRTQ